MELCTYRVSLSSPIDWGVAGGGIDSPTSALVPCASVTKAAAVVCSFAAGSSEVASSPVSMSSSSGPSSRSALSDGRVRVGCGGGGGTSECGSTLAELARRSNAEGSFGGATAVFSPIPMCGVGARELSPTQRALS